MMTLEKFEEACEIVGKVTIQTRLMFSQYFSEQSGNKIYLKPENMQKTGAFKIRGAYYKISTLTEEERGKGLITASAGNHAQGVAYAAKEYGCKAVICMPTTTPLIKVNRTKAYGAEVVLHGNDYDEACAHAYELSKEHGYTFIHPFDDLDVATGQGTISMEIFKELPLVDYILVPIGGGGLAAGVATLAKQLNPKIKVSTGASTGSSACAGCSAGAFCSTGGSITALRLSPRFGAGGVGLRASVMRRRYSAPHSGEHATSCQRNTPAALSIMVRQASYFLPHTRHVFTAVAIRQPPYSASSVFTPNTV